MIITQQEAVFRQYMDILRQAATNPATSDLFDSVIDRWDVLQSIVRYCARQMEMGEAIDYAIVGQRFAELVDDEARSMAKHLVSKYGWEDEE